MRIVCALALLPALAVGQSHPSWWNWASPDATALVGIRWETAKASPLAGALAAEIGPEGELGMPKLDCLKGSSQLLLSAPPVLAVATGNFSLDELHHQAAAESMKTEMYKGVEILISPGKSTLSLAVVSDRIFLLGFRRTLEAAVDRNQTTGDRKYSALLKRAARFSGRDLWVVASQLPDALASRFVPLDVEAKGFEGSVNLSDGIRVEGTLAAASQDDAATISSRLRQTSASLPPIARGLQVVEAGDMIVLTMAASREQVAANLRAPEPAAEPVAQAPVPKAEAPAPNPEPKTASAAAAKPAPVPVAHGIAVAAIPDLPPPSRPRVVRILGLDEGTREIELPPASR